MSENLESHDELVCSECGRVLEEDQGGSSTGDYFAMTATAAGRFCVITARTESGGRIVNRMGTG